MTDSKKWQLHREPFGSLVFEDAQGQHHTGVVPVRAFPLYAPETGFAILDSAGQELLWLDSLEGLDTKTRSLIEETLASRDFMPEIVRIKDVSSFATPSTWQLVTDRGETSLVLKGEEHIRHLGAGRLLIADDQGINFSISNLEALDRHSRRLLDRFL